MNQHEIMHTTVKQLSKIEQYSVVNRQLQDKILPPTKLKKYTKCNKKQNVYDSMDKYRLWFNKI